MGEVQVRLAELQADGHDSDCDRAERAALAFLNQVGIVKLDAVLLVPPENKDLWAIWAADSMVWTVRQARLGEWKFALRGWGRLREEVGRNGGFLPCRLSDHVGVIQRALEERIAATAQAPGVLLQSEPPPAPDPVTLSPDEAGMLLEFPVSRQRALGFSSADWALLEALCTKGLAAFSRESCSYVLTEAGRSVAQMAGAT